MALNDEAIRELQELSEHGVSIRGIARHMGISRNTVKKYLRRLKDDLQDRHISHPIAQQLP